MQIVGFVAVFLVAKRISGFYLTVKPILKVKSSALVLPAKPEQRTATAMAMNPITGFCSICEKRINDELQNR